MDTVEDRPGATGPHAGPAPGDRPDPRVLAAVRERLRHDPALAATVDESIDLAAVRARYRHERDRRLRRGGRRYRSVAREFGYYAHDPYTPAADRGPVHDAVDVLVVGAGIGGLVSAARLREAGVPRVRLLDEAGDVGGTWYWNRYPGVRCDIEATVYIPLLEELGAVPTERYATGEEIRRHCVAIAEHYGLYEHALLQTRVTDLRWDGTAERWSVRTAQGDAFTARYVITSSGTLSQPKLPDVPGVEDFRGHTFHTSRWDYAYTGGDQGGGLHRLADKKVALVGTGATGVQVMPHLARHAERLLVLQRTPSSISVRDNRPTDPVWAAQLRAGWQRERMDNFLARTSGEPVDVDLVDDGWTANAHLQRTFLPGRADTTVPPEERGLLLELQDATAMAALRARVRAEVADPRTAALLEPWYRYMCKRPCFSDEYLPAFNRPDVTLVDTTDTGGITRLTATGVVVGDDEHEVDCIVFATGFDVGVSGVLSGTLPVQGRHGEQLLESWARGPRTLHGATSPGFPNLFQLGPLQNASSVNFTSVLTQQAEHIVAMIVRAEQLGARWVEPTAEDADAWVATIAEVAADVTGFQSQCTPGYYNAEGRTAPVAAYSPGPVAFHDLLARWRAERLDDVIVGPGAHRTGGTAGAGATRRSGVREPAAAPGRDACRAAS